jgi:hypothetical protein
VAEKFGGRGDDDSWLLACGIPFADCGEKLLRFTSSMGIGTQAWPGINFNKVQFFRTNVLDEPDRPQV